MKHPLLFHKSSLFLAVLLGLLALQSDEHVRMMQIVVFCYVPVVSPQDFIFRVGEPSALYFYARLLLIVLSCLLVELVEMFVYNRDSVSVEHIVLEVLVNRRIRVAFFTKCGTVPLAVVGSFSALRGLLLDLLFYVSWRSVWIPSRCVWIVHVPFYSLCVEVKRFYQILKGH
uniref:Secreted protein n=1 Tax=Ixodes ricinus TaxID=34613 RepID=A0A6B0UZ88_IXORI